MKILHITAQNPLTYSGIPSVLKSLTQEQNKLEGIEARVLSLSADTSIVNSPYFDNPCKKEGINDYIERYDPDVAIFHSFYHVEFAYTAKALKRHGTPYFIEPHGSFGKNALKKSWLKKRIADLTIFRPLLKNAIGYIYTNECEKKNAAYYASHELVIPNGIHEDVVNHAAIKTSCTNPIFYFLGRYDIHHKGLDYLMDALQILEDAKEHVSVRLYGTGNKEQLDYLHNRINHFSSIQVEDRGTIYGDEKKKALEEASILILTSRYEGSPMTILDALSYGNPCLVTPGTNVAEEIETNNLGWKTELNAKAIADCILKAKEEYKKNYSFYYNTCRQYVLDNYLWDKIARESVEKYKVFICKK